MKNYILINNHQHIEIDSDIDNSTAIDKAINSIVEPLEKYKRGKKVLFSEENPWSWSWIFENKKELQKINILHISYLMASYDLIAYHSNLEWKKERELCHNIAKELVKYFKEAGDYVYEVLYKNISKKIASLNNFNGELEEIRTAALMWSDHLYKLCQHYRHCCGE